MKPRFEPENLSLFAIFVAPPACALNATLTAGLTGQMPWSGAPRFFFSATFLALLICFALGLVSEGIGHRWVAGQPKFARGLSAVSGLATLFCLARLVDTPGRAIEIFVVAGAFIPFLWAWLFLLFALLARPSRP